MKNKEFKGWENSTEKLLDDCWKFRKLCGKPFDRGFIGELLVLKQLLDTYKANLCSKLDNKIIYAGSANKRWDLELTLNGRTIQIDAKATTVYDKDNKPKWVRQHAKNFCDVKIKENSRQLVSLSAGYTHNLFYIFVNVEAWLKNHTPQFFTLSDKKAKSVFGKKYFRRYNGQKRKSRSTDFWVEYEDIKNFEDRRLRKLLK
jgi:hypothetical protein